MCRPCSAVTAVAAAQRPAQRLKLPPRDCVLLFVTLAILVVGRVDGICRDECTDPEPLPNGRYVKICLLEDPLPDWSNNENDDSWRRATYVQACEDEGWEAAGCGGSRSFHCHSAEAHPDYCVGLPEQRGCNPTAGLQAITGWVSFVMLQENGGSDAYLFGAAGTGEAGTYRPVCAKYTDEPGDSCQQSCPPGTISVDGYAPCTVCAAGKYAGMRATLCTNCAAGFADTDSNAGTVCQQCTAGSYSSIAATSCMQCAPGKYDNDRNASTECANCPMGQYYSSTTVCDECPAHSATRSTGTLSVSGCLCAAGYTATLTSPGKVCVACPASTYKAALGSSVCISCPANSGTSGQGHPGYDSKSACLCDPGYHGSLVDGSGVACEPCPENTYKESAGPGPCTACEAHSGTFHRTGAILRSECDCDPGFFPSVRGELGGSSNCTACSADTYKEIYGPFGCHDCVGNSSTVNMTGSDSASDCMCNVGLAGKVFKPSSCREILDRDPGAKDGVYTIAIIVNERTLDEEEIQVYCDMDGGWTLVQKVADSAREFGLWANDSLSRPEAANVVNMANEGAQIESSASGKLHEQHIKYLCSEQYTVRQMGAPDTYSHIGDGHCRGITEDERVNGRALNAVGEVDCAATCNAEERCVAYEHRATDGRCHLYGSGLDDDLPSGRRVDECPFAPAKITSDSGSCTSAMSCDDLEWPSGSGSDTICAMSRLAHNGQGEIDPPACLGGESSLVEGIGHASAICHALGARLCTADELIADEAMGTGCFDNHHVWTSTPCAGGTLSIQGNGDGNRVCQTNLSQNLGVLCCADAVVATPCLSSHPCLNNNSGTATLINNGEVKFPPHGGNYDHRLNCMWRLSCEVGRPVISVSSLSTARHDYVRIFDGSSSSASMLGEELHGELDWAEVRSGSTSDVLVQFESDASTAGRGFAFGFSCRGEPGLDEQIGNASTTGECADMVQSRRPEAVAATLLGTSCWARYSSACVAGTASCDATLWSGLAVQTCELPTGANQPALVFDGQESISGVRPRVPTSSSMRSVSVWFRPDHCAVSDLSPRSLVSWGGGTSIAQRFAVLHNGACDTSELYVGSYATNQPGLIEGWNHVLFTIKADGTMVAFHDGLVVGAQSVGMMSTGAMNSQQPLVVGARVDENGAYTDFFYGMMQRVQIWERTLTASDVWAEYNHYAGTATDSLVIDFLAAEGRWGGELVDAKDGTIMRSSALVNVALHKHASQSSTALGGVASRAIDGIDASDYDANGCSHTGDGTNEWWQVDLGTVYVVETIEIVHRTSCSVECDAELVGARVYVSATANYSAGALCGTLSNNLAVPDTIACMNAGQYVTVVQVGRRAVTICELQAMAFPVTELAHGKPTSHSARSSNETWWQVDLGAVYPISSVEVQSGPSASNTSGYAVELPPVHLIEPSNSGIRSWHSMDIEHMQVNAQLTAAQLTGTWLIQSSGDDDSGSWLEEHIGIEDRVYARKDEGSWVQLSGTAPSAEGAFVLDFPAAVLDGHSLDIGYSEGNGAENISEATVTFSVEATAATVHLSTTTKLSTDSVVCGRIGTDWMPGRMLCGAFPARYVTVRADVLGAASSISLGEVAVEGVKQQAVRNVGVLNWGSTSTRRAAASPASVGLMTEWMGYPESSTEVSTFKPAVGVVCNRRSTQRDQPPIFCRFSDVNDYSETNDNATKSCAAQPDGPAINISATNMSAACVAQYKLVCEAADTEVACSAIHHSVHASHKVCVWDGTWCTAIQDTWGSPPGTFVAGALVEGLRAPRENASGTVWLDAKIGAVHAFGMEYTVKWDDGAAHSRRMPARRLRKRTGVTGNYSKLCVDAIDRSNCESTGPLAGVCDYIPSGPSNLRGFSTWGALSGTTITNLHLESDPLRMGSPVAYGRTSSDKGCTVAGGCHVQVLCRPPEKLGIGTCEICQEDEFKDTNSGAGCEACPEHSGTNGKRASDSVTFCLCDPGYSGNLVHIDSLCTACPAGMYKSELGTASCTACPQNSNTEGRENSTDLLQCLCDRGYEGNSADGCTACGVDHYKDSVGSEACESCPERSNTEGNTARGFLRDCKCEPGYYGDLNGMDAICRACEPDTYKEMTGPEDCTDCPAYSYTREEDQNPSRRDGSSANALFIQDGELSNDGTFPQEHVVPELTGSSNIQSCRCAPGFTGLAGNCTACPADSYKEVYGGDACQQCPSHSRTVGSGKFQVSQCLCDPGYFGPGARQGLQSERQREPLNRTRGNAIAGHISDGFLKYSSSVCRACPESTYKGAAGPYDCEACLDASPNSDTAHSASTSRADCWCAAGYFGNLGNLGVECRMCDADTYKTMAGHMDCVACPANSGTLSVVGSVSASNCECDRGYTNRIVNESSFCTECEAGFYKASTGHYDCDDCPPYSLSSNRSTELGDCKCGQGYFGGKFFAEGEHGICDPRVPNEPQPAFCSSIERNGENIATYYTGYLSDSDSGCFECEANWYKSFEGPQRCTKCPQNSVTDGRRQQQSVDTCLCLPGYFGSITSPGDRCSPCEPGKYNPDVGQLQCRVCPPSSGTNGRYYSESKNDCTCDAGTFKNTTGSCQECPPGMYKAASGDTSCTACPVNSGTGYVPHATDDPSFHTELFSRATSILDCSCKPGYSNQNSSNSSSPCLICSYGYFKAYYGQSDCVACGPGTQALVSRYNAPWAPDAPSACACDPGHRNIPGQAWDALVECELCPQDTYKEHLSSEDDCRPCLDHSSTLSAVGVNSSLACICNRGYSGSHGGPCNACPAGQYKEETGSSRCRQCPANSNTQSPQDAAPRVAQINVEQCYCNRGYTGTITAANDTCEECISDYYKSTQGSAVCSVCPANTLTKGNRAVGTARDCFCIDGYVNSGGQYASNGTWMRGYGDCTRCKLDTLDPYCEIFPPRVQLNPIDAPRGNMTKINPSARLALTAVVEEGASIDWAAWTGVSNSDINSRFAMGQPFLAPNTGISDPFLIVATGQLIPGSWYRIRLTATIRRPGATMDAAATSEVQFGVNERPAGGEMSVTPRVGVALEDTFFARATGWVDDDRPLSYTFGVSRDASDSTLWMTAATPNSTFATILPHGTLGTNHTYYLNLVVMVTDLYGAQTRHANAVDVRPWTPTGPLADEFGAKLSHLNNGTQAASTVAAMAVILNSNASRVHNSSAAHTSALAARNALSEYLLSSVLAAQTQNASQIALFAYTAQMIAAVPDQVSLECMDSVMSALDSVAQTPVLEAEAATAIISTADNIFVALDSSRGAGLPSVTRVPRLVRILNQASVGVAARLVAGEPPEVKAMTKFLMEVQKFQTAKGNGTTLANGMVTLPNMDIAHLNSLQWINRTFPSHNDLSSQTIVWADGFNPFKFGGVRPANEGVGETVALRSQVLSFSLFSNGREVILRDLPEPVIVNLSLHPSEYYRVPDTCEKAICINKYDIAHYDGACEYLLGEGRYSCDDHFCTGCPFDGFCDLSCSSECTHARDCVGPLLEPIQAHNETDCLITGNTWHSAVAGSCSSLSGSPSPPPSNETTCTGGKRWVRNRDPLGFVCLETTSQLILSGMGKDPGPRYGPILNASDCAEKGATHHADNCGSLGHERFKRCENPDGHTACVPWTACPSRLHEWYRPEYMCETLSGHNAMPERRVSDEASCQNGNRWTASQPAVCRASDGKLVTAYNESTCENTENRWSPQEVRDKIAAREAAAAISSNISNASLAELTPRSFTCELTPEISCSYWNPAAGRWMQDGIVLDKRPQYMLCGFNHLTDFGGMIGAPPQTATLPSLKETFWLGRWLRSTLGLSVAAAISSSLLLCAGVSCWRYLSLSATRTRKLVKEQATGDPIQKGDYADAIFALNGFESTVAYQEHSHTETMLRTRWNFGAMCIPVVGDPTTRTQRFVIVLVGVLCTMTLELMFFTNPIFPTIDVCEGRQDANGLSTNCSARTMEQQLEECECKTFFSANGCGHCADGPFEGATSRVGPRGALQNCTSFCQEYVPSQAQAVIMTAVMTTVVSLLLHQLLNHLHRPFLDMLRVEGTVLREGEKEELKRLRDNTRADLKARGLKHTLSRRLSRRLRLPTELRSLQSSNADQAKMIAAMHSPQNDLDVLPPLLGKKVWYTTESGSHIPVAPEMRRQALKKLDDKRKAMIIDLLLSKAARNRADYKRIVQRKKKLRSMPLPRLKTVAQKELKMLGKASIDDQGRYVRDVQDALTFVRGIPDYSPQLDDPAVRSKRIIVGVYLCIFAIGACCALVIADNVLKLSAANAMQWLYGSAMSVAIHLVVIEPVRVLLLGHAKRRWHGLHREIEERPCDELNAAAPDTIKLGGLSEEEQLAKDKEEIKRVADSIQQDDIKKSKGSARDSRWASVTTKTKVASAFKMASKSRGTGHSNSTKPAEIESMIRLGPPSASGADRLASGVAVAKASRKLAKKKRNMAKASIKLATFTQTLTATQAEVIDTVVETFHDLKNSHIMEKHLHEREQADIGEEREILNVRLNAAMNRFDKLIEAFKADVQKVASGESLAQSLEDSMMGDLSDELLDQNLTYDAIMDAYEAAAEQARKKLSVREDGSALSASMYDRLDEHKAEMRRKASRLEDLMAKYDWALDDLIENSNTLELDEVEILEAGLDPDPTTGHEIASIDQISEHTNSKPAASPQPPIETRPAGGTGRFATKEQAPQKKSSLTIATANVVPEDLDEIETVTML